MGVETVGDVTFINGVAAEQQTEGESAQPADEREAAIKAVKEALQEEGKRAASKAKESRDQDPLQPRDSTERDEAGKFVAKPKSDEKKTEAKPAPSAEEDAESLKNVLKQRKQLAAAKAQQSQQVSKELQELRQYKQQLDYERQEVQREKARIAALRTDPARAIKEAGWDPEEFILDLARQGTPEGAAARQQRELRDQLKELHDWKASQAKQAEEAQVAAQRRQQANYRQHVEKTFVSLAMDEAKHPHLAGMYAGHEAGLLAEADVIAEQYRNLTGKEASFEDVAEYLEERSANWYKTMSTKSQQAQAPVTRGKPTQGNGTGKTLSPEGGSERRSLGTMLADLDGEERLAAAREAVGAAFKFSGARS